MRLRYRSWVAALRLYAPALVIGCMALGTEFAIPRSVRVAGLVVLGAAIIVHVRESKRLYGP